MDNNLNNQSNIEQVNTNIIENNSNNSNNSNNNDTNNLKEKKSKSKVVIIIFIISILLIVSGVVLSFLGIGKNANGSSNPFSSTKKIDGVEIPSGMKTYAIISAAEDDEGNTTEATEIIVRYDSNGNFKYYKFTDTYYADSEDEAKNMTDAEIEAAINENKCSKQIKLNYAGAESICSGKDRKYTYGYVYTDKSIEEGILNDSGVKDRSVLSEVLHDYEYLKNENDAEEYFKELQDSGNFKTIIMANKKVN